LLEITFFGLQEFNIKVFDFGFVTNTFIVDDSFLDGARAPEILKGMFV